MGGLFCLVGEKAGEVQEMKIKRKTPTSSSIWGLYSPYISSATKQRIEGKEIGFEVPIHKNQWGLFCLVGKVKKWGLLQEHPLGFRVFLHFLINQKKD